MGKMIQWFKKPSISKKLVIAFLVVLILPTVALTISAFFTSKTELDKQIMGSAMSQVNAFDTLIDENIGNKAEAVTLFTDDLKAANLQEKNRKATIKELQQYGKINEKDVSAIYAGSEKGLFMQYPVQKMPEGYDPRERPWYQEAMSADGKQVITKPYVAASTGKMVITIAQKTKDGSGVIGLDMEIDSLIQKLKEIKIGQKGYAFIMEKDKTVLADPTQKPGSKVNENLANIIFKNKQGNGSYTLNGTDKKVAYVTNELTGWKIGGTMLVSEVEDAAKPVFNTAIIVFSVTLIVAGTLIFFIVRSISNRLSNLARFSKKVSDGDLRDKLQIQSDDEIGQVGKGFNTMIDSLRSLIGAVQTSVENVASSSEELTASAGQTSKATEHITLAIEQFSTGNESQNDKVESSSEELEEMNRGLQHMNESAESITASSIKSTEIAGEGGQLVEKTASQMNVIDQSVKKAENVISALESKSKDITQILGVINGIADQTNLLALNAAIEAARAGESGRGFSVVAEEVRKLAVQSANSAKEIENLIKEIVQDIDVSQEVFTAVNQEVQSGLSFTEQTKVSFHNIFDMTKEISDQLQTMNRTVVQLSKGSAHVSEAVREIADVSRESSANIQDIAASAEEQLASMEEISSSSATLSSMAEELRDLISKFKVE
ncbi:methyl-accepting chemotaxis protein [Bacillus altitudinis]|uniref:methyl-accepting chemotaxis protein n=1 Tax=Bacillus sp. FSL W8-1141 TaxID=2954646 RepID=UPI00045C9A0C|nr:methyl-accepting chemotaxis protein [Bacillus altitudinis]MBW3701553.1 HAMP domain-containing protein [Bacillus aerophilus]KDE31884.1 methyl-accepting chemotaxis protein [Bacillus altitudinis 41KF2b]KWZ64771.1 chemotaxis protein [Bacillus altitudinis]MDT1119387.1 methyl-accepting chemotaxis protein [Bacillus altitudinis]MEC1041773.1 methyl-accepting chemotaxis protein [Bacillus altitudinis]